MQKMQRVKKSVYREGFPSIFVGETDHPIFKHENISPSSQVSNAMVSCSRFIRIKNSSNHRRVSTAILLDTKSLPNPLDHKLMA